MQVIASIKGMDQRLYVKLLKLGIDARWVGSQGSEEIVVYLPSGDSPLSFKIPDEISQFPYCLCVNCMEHGEKGKGVVVCGRDGSKLRYYRKESQEPPGKERAYFNVLDQVVTVTANGGEEPKMVIREYRILPHGAHIYLASSQIWCGRRIEHLPGKFKYFRRAVLAAIEKKACEPCRHSHFSLEVQNTTALGARV